MIDRFLLRAYFFLKSHRIHIFISTRLVNFILFTERIPVKCIEKPILTGSHRLWYNIRIFIIAVDIYRWAYTCGYFITMNRTGEVFIGCGQIAIRTVSFLIPTFGIGSRLGALYFKYGSNDADDRQ